MQSKYRNGFIIGMVHTLPLPGTPNYKNNLDDVVKRAVREAKTLFEAGVDGIMVENMLDLPFAETLDIEQVTALTRIATSIREVTGLPLGINAAFNDYKAALAIAKTVNAQFVRIPVFVDTMVYAGGIIYPCAREAMQYRKGMNATDIAIFADIQVKHAYSLTSSMPIEESAVNAAMNGADVVIVTGASTGKETPLDLIKAVKAKVDIPVFIGSGVDQENIVSQLKVADGAIVGSSLKEAKDIYNEVSYDLTRTLINAKENLS